MSKHISNDRKEGTPDWKSFDVEKAVKQDIGAAVSLLSLILDHPHILAIVVGEIEKIREKMIEAESMKVNAKDFHPELSPNGK